jgi:tryptophan-rich sensory protein
MKINIKKLIVSVVVPLAVGAIAGMATSKNVGGWYTTLQRPSFAPPNYLFGPVWTSLYILMGIAFYIIWTKEDASHWKKRAIGIFLIQLALNFMWSFIFFELKWMGIAFVEICLMWLAIFLTILVFSRLSKIAAWLLVPYICWVTFASILNYYYWYLNYIKQDI